jgi:uncharacterized membrane protein YqaE (UPF0057 family)
LTKCRESIDRPGDRIYHARPVIFIEGSLVMRLLLAIFLPWFQFFTIGRPFAGVICLILQITLIGWIPAAIWSVYALSQYKTDKKIEKALGRVV